MTTLAVAIAIHVLSVAWWIGGLAFVTTVVLPVLRAGQTSDAAATFHLIESRFAPQARVAVLLVIALAIIGGAVAGSHGL